MANFKVSDCVQLISGGPKMTIEEIEYIYDYKLSKYTTEPSGIVKCVWFKSDDLTKSYRGSFNVNTLKPCVDKMP